MESPESEDPEDLYWREVRATDGYGYVRQHAPWLLRPGITFTPEQWGGIEKAVKEGRMVDAQRAILDHLGRQLGDGA